MSTMQWFGAAFGAPYEADTPHVPTPVGALCGHCGERIGFHDDGLLVPLLGDPEFTHRPYHYACHMRLLVGGLNHQMGRCTCCGGTEPPDPPNMSLREAARLAMKNWMNRDASHRQ
jgi:hypothetical protein